MKNKKAFTLIELIATISILSMILLIAISTVINIMESSRREAYRLSVASMVKSANSSYSKEFIDKYGDITTAVFTYEDGVETSNIAGLTAKFDGEKPESGNIVIRSDGKTAASLHNGKYCASKYFNSNDVNITETTEEACLQSLYLPSIVINGLETYTIEVRTAFVEPSITAYNMVEQEITTYTKQYLYNNVPVGSINTNLLGQHKIRYTVTDEGYSNVREIVLNTVDTTRPVITRTGSASVSVALGAVYTDQGATATDNFDTSLTVVRTNPVNTNIAGVYTVRYNVTDTSGNSAIEVTRTVTVNPRTEYRFRDYTCSSTCYDTCYSYTAANQSTSCPPGSTNEGGVCKQYDSPIYYSNQNCTCSSGSWSCSHSSYSGQQNCSPGFSYRYIPSMLSSNCPGSCSPNGSTKSCSQTWQLYCDRTVSGTTTYSCSSGTLEGTQCRTSYSCNPYSCGCSWGTWSGWSTTVYTASGSRQVETRQVTSI